MPDQKKKKGAPPPLAHASPPATPHALPPPHPKKTKPNPKTTKQQAFYEDLFEELARFGEIEAVAVCDNVADHMVGNVYVRFRDEREARAALEGVQGRIYEGRPVSAELSPVTDFREAACRQYDEGGCNRGGYCNFMHVKPLARDLRQFLYGRYGRGGGGRFGGGGGGGGGGGRRRTGGGGGRRRSRSPDGRGRERERYGGGGGGGRDDSEERRARIAAWGAGGGGGAAAY